MDSCKVTVYTLIQKISTIYNGFLLLLINPRTVCCAQCPMPNAQPRSYTQTYTPYSNVGWLKLNHWKYCIGYMYVGTSSEGYHKTHHIIIKGRGPLLQQSRLPIYSLLLSILVVYKYIIYREYEKRRLEIEEKGKGYDTLQRIQHASFSIVNFVPCISKSRSSSLKNL